MAKRPPGVDPALWREQRAEVWRRRNRVFNVLMIVSVLLVLARYFAR